MKIVTEHNVGDEIWVYFEPRNVYLKSEVLSIYISINSIDKYNVVYRLENEFYVEPRDFYTRPADDLESQMSLKIEEEHTSKTRAGILEVIKEYFTNKASEAVYKKPKRGRWF